MRPPLTTVCEYVKIRLIANQFPLSKAWIEVEESHSTNTKHLQASYSTNPPVTIQGRPEGNIITIAFRDLNKVKPIPTIIPKFVLFLRFEKI